MNYLAGHYFYAVQHETTKQKARGCKYLGQTPIYQTLNKPSITIKRIIESSLDEVNKLCYSGTYDTGSSTIPLFKQE